MPVCPACGQSNPARARFCMSCASRLPGYELAPQGARKTVTIVFCDVKGSTALGDALDPESVREVMTRFFRTMRDALVRHGGSVEKYIGDAVMATFGIPLLREDDALRAVRAAVEMRTALDALNEDLAQRFGVRIETRTGVNTGEVVVGDIAAGHALVVGDAVNVAARLEQAASPGEILLGQETFALVRDHVNAEPVGPLRLKGKPDALTAYRLLDVDAGADAIGSRPEPPLVGRERELASLGSAFDAALAEGSSVLFTVIGPAGVGKSRLSQEFVTALGDGPLVLRARCLPYGDSITFWAVVELVKQACGIGDDDPRATARAKIELAVRGAEDGSLIAERLAALLGAAMDHTLQETFWAVRRFLECLGQDRPLVVILDDLQWAEPSFLDLVEYLAGWSKGVALLVVCLTRPDLTDARPTWGVGLASSHALALEPLDDEQSATLITELLDGAPIDVEATRRISEAAGGNPLFIEEMLRMLEDDGLLRREADGWLVTGDLAHVDAPASIQALLGSRLDRLTPEELAVVRCASVIGKVFWWGAVAELAPEELAPHVGTYLQALVRRNLIRPERSTFAGEDCFGFHHILIQEAAYRGTPKEQRADLHERFASWIERMAGDRLVEFEEVIGYHLERSYRYHAELGIPVDELRPLGRRAGRPLASAGARALERRDIAASSELLGRAAALLPEDDPGRVPVLLELGETRTESGDLEGAEAALDEAERLAEVSGDGAAAANASILRLFLLEWSDPKRLPEDPTVGAERLIRRLDELGDDRGVARAWRLMGDLFTARSRYAEADEAFERAIEHARLADDRREEADARGRYIGSGVYGPAPADEVARRCDEALAAVGGPGGAGGHEAPVLRALAVVRGMEGRFDEARGLAARAREILRDRGLRLRATWVSETSGTIERLAGDLAAAEREFRQGFEEADELGDHGFRATVAAALAHTLVEQGRVEEADELVRLAETSAAEDDLASQVLWRSTRGRMLALSGAADEAQAMARDAIALVERTDDINMHADTLVDLAEVFAGGEDPIGAMDALDRAIGLYERKGNIVAAVATRRRRDAAS